MKSTASFKETLPSIPTILNAEEAFIEQKGEDCYEIDGLTPLEELGEELEIDFSEEDFETLNVAHDFFQNVFHGKKPRGLPVFVNDKNHMGFDGLHASEQNVNLPGTKISIWITAAIILRFWLLKIN